MKKLILLLALVLICACAKKPSVTPVAPAQRESLADIAEFPQNLEVYAREAGPGRRLVSEQAQAAADRTFNNIFFGPWEMTRTTIPRREVSSVFGRARGYRARNIPWTTPEWEAIRANAAIGSFPSRSSQAITLRQTDLREVPTHEPRYAQPEPDPFDYIQYASLPPGMPVLVVHTSADRNWHYVECPITGGWVDAKDIALVDPAFKSNWQTDEYAAIITDKVTLPGTGPGGKDSLAPVGTILPVAKRGINGSLNVLVPIADRGGMAKTAEVPLTAAQAEVKPVPLTGGNVAKVGNAMMGQPYVWGGSAAGRDCSSMIRDLFAPFGLWLPRNSSAQARRGHVIRLEGMDSQQKAQTIMREGIPFLSLVGMPGHITLYVGNWKNRPAIFHNVWGLRIVKDGNDNERFIIGRAVVTSITPGMELENLYRPKTFVDRLRTLSTPARP